MPSDGKIDPPTIFPQRVVSLWTLAGLDEINDNGPRSAFLLFRGRARTWWRVEDSNLCSFRDGFTVRSHWPLGQPARASPPRRGVAAEPRIAVAPGASATGYRQGVVPPPTSGTYVH